MQNSRAALSASEFVGDGLAQCVQVLGERVDASGQLLGGHRVGSQSRCEAIAVDRGELGIVGLGRGELARQLAVLGVELSSRSGEMVRRSQPANASICAVERNDAPMTTVDEPRCLNAL